MLGTDNLLGTSSLLVTHSLWGINSLPKEGVVLRMLVVPV